MGLNECTNKNLQFIHEYTGLSEKSISELHKLTTYEKSNIRLAIIDYLLCDTDFSHFLLDDIAEYYERYERYQAGKTAFQNRKSF